LTKTQQSSGDAFPDSRGWMRIKKNNIKIYFKGIVHGSGVAFMNTAMNLCEHGNEPL
jgi:hypothetical protein